MLIGSLGSCKVYKLDHFFFKLVCNNNMWYYCIYVYCCHFIKDHSHRD